MNARRLILLVGAVLLVAGLIALLVPVSITGDGESIGCGNAIAADSSEAEAANNKTDFVANCQAAVSSRRTWSIPLTVIGALAVLGSLAVPRTRTVS